MRTILGDFHAQALTLSANQATHLFGTGTARPQDGRKSLLIQNNTGAVLYVGGPLVNAAQGYPLATGRELSFDATGGLFAFSVAGGVVNILEGF